LPLTNPSVKAKAVSSTFTTIPVSVVQSSAQHQDATEARSSIDDNTKVPGPSHGSTLGPSLNPLTVAALPDGRTPGQLAINKFRETPLLVRELMIVAMVQQWNFSIPSHSCCAWHAALRSVQEVLASLADRACMLHFRPRCEWQCRSCGVVGENTTECEVCGGEGTTSSGSYCSAGHQLDTSESLESIFENVEFDSKKLTL
jgi:hypothetical protein